MERGFTRILKTMVIMVNQDNSGSGDLVLLKIV